MFCVPKAKNLHPYTETVHQAHWALIATGGSDSPHLAAQGPSKLCQADPPASPCLQSMDPLTRRSIGNGQWASTFSWMAKQWPPCSAAAVWFVGKQKWKNTLRTGRTSWFSGLIAFTLNTCSRSPGTHWAQPKGKVHQQLYRTAHLYKCQY